MRFQFDARRIPPNTGQVVEKWSGGWHPVTILSSDGKPIKDQQNSMRLSFKIQCIGGPDQGKINYIGLNLAHSSAETVRIANEHLSAICWCAGKPVINGDTDELNGSQLVVFAVVTEQGNNFTAFKNMQGVDAMTLAQQNGGLTTAGAQAAPPGGPAGGPPAGWQGAAAPPIPTGLPGGPPVGWNGAAPAAAPAPAAAAPVQQWQQPAAVAAPAPGAWNGAQPAAPAPAAAPPAGVAPAPGVPAWGNAAPQPGAPSWGQ